MRRQTFRPCLSVPEVRDDPAVYPPERCALSLHKGVLHSPKEERAAIPSLVAREDGAVTT